MNIKKFQDKGFNFYDEIVFQFKKKKRMDLFSSLERLTVNDKKQKPNIRIIKINKIMFLRFLILVKRKVTYLRSIFFEDISFKYKPRTEGILDLDSG